MNFRGQGHYAFLRSRSFNDLGPRSIVCRLSIFSENFSGNTGPISIKFHMLPSGKGKKGVHMYIHLFGVTRASCPPFSYSHILENPLIIFFLQNYWADCLGTWFVYLELQYYKDCINNDRVLTLTYFTARSNLVP